MQVAKNLSPEIAAQYNKFLARKAVQDKVDAEIKAQWVARRTAIQAQVEATRLNEIHTAQKEYICENEKCGGIIAKGTRYRRQNIPVGYGYFEGTHFQTRITHLVCATTGGIKE